MTKQDVKLVAESVLASLNLDYAVFDVAADPVLNAWELTFFDRSRARGQCVFHIPVRPNVTSPHDAVKDAVRLELTSRLDNAKLGRC